MPQDQIIELLKELPDLQRIAAGYLPLELRAAGISLLAFDQRLARIIRQGDEPALKQIKLAWWRERLGEAPDDRPRGDAVLDALVIWQGHEEGLIAMVDGWEQLLVELLGHAEILEHAQGRAAAFGKLATVAGRPNCTEAAKNNATLWALADLAANLPDGGEKDHVLSIGNEAMESIAPLPRTFRSLRILAELGRKSLDRSGEPPLSRRSDALVALRIGLFGR